MKMKRLDYIDIAKGICMLLIMFGHCSRSSAPLSLIVWIYSFHVIAFYIISGLLSAHVSEFDRPWKGLVKKSFFRLIVPYYGFQFLYAVIYCARFGLHNFKWLLIDILIFAPEDYATWFLPVLFVARLYVILLKNTIKNVYTFYTVLLASMFTVMAIPTSSITLLALAEKAIVASGFIAIGMLFDRVQDKAVKSIPVMVISLAMSIPISMLNGRISTYAGNYQNPFLCVLAGIAGTLFLLSISYRIHSEILSDFGKHSIAIVGTHQLVLQFLSFHYAVSFLIITAFEYILITLLKFRQQCCCTS